MRYITNIEKIKEIPSQEKESLKKITNKFVFRVNEYYLNLINWQDPDDPIRKIIIPNKAELDEYGRWDASDEQNNYVAKGIQHKYRTTALLLVSEVCGAYCRFCFRKRLFKNEVKETTTDISEGISYIKMHPEINNVLLTGGDSLILSTKRIKEILQQLREIPHVKIIRMGSKLLAFNPMRIYEDEELLAALKKHSYNDAKIHLMAHFNHPNEITEQSLRAIAALQNHGVIIVNQTPVLKGVNDDPIILAELLNKLSYIGITPYYFFQNRPVAGNASFVLDLQEAYEIIEQAKAKVSGLGKRVKFVMSHSTGKIEILAVKNKKVYLKYHQAKNPANYGKFMIFDLQKGDSWFDDLKSPAPIEI